MAHKRGTAAGLLALALLTGCQTMGAFDKGPMRLEDAPGQGDYQVVYRDGYTCEKTIATRPLLVCSGWEPAASTPDYMRGYNDGRQAAIDENHQQNTEGGGG